MGGLVCQIHFKAVVRFDAVPTRPMEVKQFDIQIRQFFNVTTIANSVAEDPVKGPELCLLLSKRRWTQEDRVTLFEIGEHLYED
jgi:hypothetical protein